MVAVNRAGWWPFGGPRDGTRSRLFCLPYAGGGASIFRGWRRAAPIGIDLCPLQLPGREMRIREAPLRRVEPLVDALAEELRPHLAVPYALFGHSMGALVAFELTHRLAGLALPPPVRLFVSGARPPHLMSGRPSVFQLPDAEFRAALRDLDGTPEAILADDELMDLLLPTLRADFELCETYRYQDRGLLPCPITALGGSRDPQVSQEDLDAWALLTGAGFESALLAGDHFFLIAQSSEVLRRVVARLEEAGPAPPPVG